MAYLGPEPAPMLPNWDVYSMSNVVRDIGYAMLPCNWLQCQENSLDPVHLEWLHSAFTNYVLERLDRSERVNQKKHAKIGFDEFEYGIVKRRVVVGGTEEDTAWADGHPIVFPNMLRQGGSGDGTPGIGGMMGPAFQIRTPIDDNNTAHWWVACYPRLEGEAGQEPEDIPVYYPIVPELTAEGQPKWDILDTNSAQDPSAWITQGQIADRTQEHLGRSDKGIILYRQMLEDNIKKVEQGQDPMNTFRDADENVVSVDADRATGWPALRRHAHAPGRRDEVQPDFEPTRLRGAARRWPHHGRPGRPHPVGRTALSAWEKGEHDEIPIVRAHHSGVAGAWMCTGAATTKPSGGRRRGQACRCASQVRAEVPGVARQSQAE